MTAGVRGPERISIPPARLETKQCGGPQPSAFVYRPLLGYRRSSTNSICKAPGLEGSGADGARAELRLRAEGRAQPPLVLDAWGHRAPPVLGLVARQFSGWSPTSFKVGRLVFEFCSTQILESLVLKKQDRERARPSRARLIV